MTACQDDRSGRSRTPSRAKRAAAAGDQLEVKRGLLADAVDFAKPLDRRGEDARETAEAFEQFLGDRLGVPPRQRLEQDQLEQFIVGQGLAAACLETFG